MKWFKEAFFVLSRILSQQSTLQTRTWQLLLMQHSPGLKAIRKERRKEQRYRSRNSFKGAFKRLAFIFFVLAATCFIPAAFIDQYLRFLEWFRFDDIQKAYGTVSEVMGATATIIGLSFVVIGFLFDIVRDKTQRTLEELFRATNLYYVFGISVMSIGIIVILNCSKYTVTPYIAKNFAVLSSGILLIDVGAIAYLFYQLLRFFNPERVARIGSLQMLELARYRMLDDRFSKASADVYRERLLAFNCQEKFEFASFLTKGKPVPLSLKLDYKKDVGLIDVHFPMLRFLIQRLKKRCAEVGFTGLRYGNPIRPNQGILSLPNGIRLFAWERLAFSAAYLTSDPISDTDDFDLMKKQLEKRLLKASADGDLDGIKQSFDDIENLYNIYYTSNA